MKTPDEIKRGLECCAGMHNHSYCKECPYADCDCDEMSSDALAYIKQLEMVAKPNEQIRWERDIAIDQLKQLGIAFGEKIEAQVPRWISAEERLPDENGKYIVCTTKGSVYCIMRPPAPGAIPPGAVSVTEHLSRCYAPEIDRMVWGCVTYDRELTTCEIAEYELIREPR